MDYALLYITTSCKIFSKNLKNLTIVCTIPNFSCKMPPYKLLHKKALLMPTTAKTGQKKSHVSSSLFVS